MSARTHVVALVAAAWLVASASGHPSAQLRLATVTDKAGVVALELALRTLGTTGTFMMTTAHPDDENNALLAMLGLGQGIRTVLVTATRGDGGQNEIGPELFDALAVLRTEEIAAAHRFDGAEQYFTRAVDFGYSFSIDETFARWGRDEIVGDFVRLIRTVRPDVIAGFIWDGTGGGQHHQASSRLTAEAFRAAGDPSKFPEQLREGLRPWQPKKFYYLAGFMRRDAPPQQGRMLTIDGGAYDPFLGKTFAQLGIEARSMHRCQGTQQLQLLPGAQWGFRYKLHETVLPGQLDKDETSMFDGLDVSLGGLVRLSGEQPPAELVSGLASIAGHVGAASAGLASKGPDGAIAPLAAGLGETRTLGRRLATMGLGDDLAFEIGFRLAQKEQQFERALALALGLRVDVLADDGVVVAGQPIKVTMLAAAQSASPVTIRGVRHAGFDTAGPACANGATSHGKPWQCVIEGKIPGDAQATSPYFTRRADVDRYDFDPQAPFGLPFRPTPYRVSIDVSAAGQEFVIEAPVQFRYEGAGLTGEKRMELHVVPAMAVRVTPEIVIVPVTAPDASAGSAPAADVAREVRVTVTNGTRGPARGDVMLEAPTGWKVAPSSSPVAFTREDEQVTVRFTIQPSPGARVGDYPVEARVVFGGVSHREGYEVIEYGHTSRRHVVQPADVLVKVLDVKTAPDLNVGYVVGVGDQVPPALEQLGAVVRFLDADELSWGDLSKYDVIMTGVRAYERRPDLRANNRRLLDYAERGGTVVVQYNKFEFNEAQYGPYPAKVSADRVTDESAPVRVLVPEHPVFTTPNRVTDSTWKGWVQERGLYFLGERDPRYVDLVETQDPFDYNAGAKRGALVEARVGQGRWIYVGLGLWRQLPAGTAGAYQLMANLVSLGKAN